ncbi:MAG: ABC transporter substrate-binding protein [Gemmatimonadaceae bacterium]
MYATRQNFIALFWLFSLVAFEAAKLTAQTNLTLRVGLVTRANPVPSAASIARGVQLGAAEAEKTATLFGGSVLLFEESVTSRAEAAAARLLSQRKVQLLVGSSAQDAEALSRFAETHGLIFFNAASRSSALRVSCRRHTFNVEASDSMYSSALRRRTTPGVADSAVLWAASLEKYGASQVNERFRNRYKLPMDGSAWAGWIAVKIAAEAALRARSARPADLLAYLEASSTSFDGHKGWPLSFRSVDHQLRQPLYVVARLPRGSLPRIQETPQLSALGAAGATANQLLDQLMPQASSCRQNRI